MRFDHLALATTDLVAGAALIEAALGVSLAPSGRHARMGTWNRVLSLGGSEYLELIAIDPEAADPGRPRWFALDEFSGRTRPCNWVAACDDLAAEALPGAGEALAFERGPYRWRMLVPADGYLPFAGLQPAQIAWDGPHPALALPASGCRLTRLTLVSPDAKALAARLSALADPRIVVAPGAAPAIRAEIATPSGPKVLE
jgi:Glyoxalase-like domain